MSYSSAAVLQMPSSYVPMSSEEMEYLEGGATKRTYVRTDYIDAYTCSEISARFIDGTWGGTIATGVLAYLKYNGYCLLGIVMTALQGLVANQWSRAANRGGLVIDVYKITYPRDRGSRGKESYVTNISFAS